MEKHYCLNCGDPTAEELFCSTDCLVEHEERKTWAIS